MSEALDLQPTQGGTIKLSSDFMKRATENIEVALETLSYKNEREYKATYRMWQDYTMLMETSPMDFDLMRVKTFLTDNDWSFNTRKTRLAHLRKFAELLAKADENNEYRFAYNFGRLSLLKPKTLGGQKTSSKPINLSHKQIYQIFDSQHGDSNRATRNRALLGLMLLAGLRSSEIVSLKWEHINFVDNLLFIFEGKGDKSAEIPMLGDLPILLGHWLSLQARNSDYNYVCSQIYRSDKIAKDKQCNTRTITFLCESIMLDTGIDFKPHDARRTAITALLDSGATVPQVRDFARHASGETTLIYAQRNSAIALGSSLQGKLKYGDVLGDMRQSKQIIRFECDNGHKFEDYHAKTCPKCGSTNLSKQTSFFD